MSFASDLLQKVSIGGKNVLSKIDNAAGQASEFVRQNPATSAATIAGGAAATGLGITAIQIIKKKRAASKKKKATKKKTTTRKKTKKKRTLRKGQKRPYTAGKRRDTSTRRIRYTKNNQPYVILKSGKARFIKKSSVRRMRKLKGGKY